MKALALIVLGLWIFGGYGYFQAVRGPRTDDFGQGVFVVGVLMIATLLTIVLAGWALISAWPK